MLKYTLIFYSLTAFHFAYCQSLPTDHKDKDTIAVSDDFPLSKSGNCSYEWVTPITGLSNYCEEPDRNDWHLVFEDNFDGPNLDQSKWLFGYGWADFAGDALYLPQNMSFDFPGELHFNLDTSNVVGKGVSYAPNTEQIFLYNDVYVNNYREWDCTSAAIRSKRLFMYGKFEIKCWFDDYDHNFPAFWLYGGPSYNEIDIVEFKGQWNNVATNMHHDPTKNKGVASCSGGFNPLFQGSWANGWHRYRCEWDMWKISYFVDDTPIRTVYRFVDASLLPITSIAQYESKLPFVQYNKAFPRTPMHLIANNTVNDAQGSNVSGGKMKIDYIKVWSKNSMYDHLDIDNSNALFVPDENHHYLPNTGGFDDIVRYMREEEVSDFVDGHGGDLNGDGKDEFVSVRNFDGHILIHEISEVGGKYRFQERGRYTLANSSSNWAGISCGDVDGDGKDEIVAVRNVDAGIFIWDVDYDTVSQVFSLLPKCSFVGSNQFSDWKGIECGDFDADGVDEFALVRGLDQRVFFKAYDPTSNGIVSVASHNGFGVESDIVDLTAGDFNGDGKDEVAVVRNLDGNLYILQLDDNLDPFVRLAWTAPNSESDWTAISAGKYKGDANDQIVMHRTLDNMVKMVEANSYVGSVTHDLSCSVPVGIGSGFFGGSCENFVILNNFGGYELKKLSGACDGSTTGLDEWNDEEIQLLVIVYPNPTKGNTTVVFNERQSGRLSLFSLDGKLISQKRFVDEMEYEIDMENLNHGVYTLIVQTDHGNAVKKVVKN